MFDCFIFILLLYATVPDLHPTRTAFGSFFNIEVHTTKDNTPSMPLCDAHLGGFFILRYNQ